MGNMPEGLIRKVVVEEEKKKKKNDDVSRINCG
jgi:hypothetical protein